MPDSNPTCSPSRCQAICNGATYWGGDGTRDKMNWARRQLQQVKAFLTEPPPRATPPSPIFDRFCIAFLVVDWIVFGSMHFSLHDGTRRMMPLWVPFSDAVVVGTGFAEVTVGMLMLYARTRRI